LATNRRFPLFPRGAIVRARLETFLDFVTALSVRAQRHQRRQGRMHASFARRSERIMSNLMAKIGAIGPSDDASANSLLRIAASDPIWAFARPLSVARRTAFIEEGLYIHNSV